VLQVGETWTYTGAYTVQQSDLNDNGGGDGDIDNTATVSSDQLPDQSSSIAQSLVYDPQYSIVKTVSGADVAGNGQIDHAGEVIDYQIVVGNDGNVDLIQLLSIRKLLGLVHILRLNKRLMIMPMIWAPILYGLLSRAIRLNL
jgi:hypothetical protein